MGVLGGTFDPVHVGHLQLAVSVRQALALDDMRLMPAHIPPHRASPQVDAQVRAQLVQQALIDYPELQLDTRELRVDAPSYTVNSLRDLRAELGAEAGLYFAMGMDSLCNLDRWHQWQRLTDFAHLVVLARPGETAPVAGPLARWIAERECDRAGLLARPSGGLWQMQSALIPVSATEIRAALAAGQAVDHWLSPAVANYIRQHRLYGPSVRAD